jgi:tRNA-2-methylthio-N6-dimethylallyladenosine synthase
MSVSRTYQIRTYGCQMNMHDSERLAGLLEDAGYQRAPSGEPADVVVFNTCAVRENADNRLYGNLGHLLPVKQSRPGMQIAVGGCLAQKDRAGIAERAPWVDVVFGTHNIGSLPALLERARVQEAAQVEIAESLERFPSVLPARRESSYSAWVAISVGCNNTCTFCIVPSLRGREEDRRPGDVLAEIRALTGDGVIEVTLLGQNVNSYGVGFGDQLAFGKLLRACGGIDGLEQVLHLAAGGDFTDDVTTSMAETPNVMPQLHMPLPSGSHAVLRAMRRAYRREKYLAILDRVRAAMPDAAITTDIIVGFPGETDRDFEDTLDLVRQARFAGAFTFQYSPRPGTPAAGMGAVPWRWSRSAISGPLRWSRRVAGRERVLAARRGAGGRGRGQGRRRAPAIRARDSRLVPPRMTPRAQPGNWCTAVTGRPPPAADGAPAGGPLPRGSDVASRPARTDSLHAHHREAPRLAPPRCPLGKPSVTAAAPDRAPPRLLWPEPACRLTARAAPASRAAAAAASEPKPRPAVDRGAGLRAVPGPGRRSGIQRAARQMQTVGMAVPAVAVLGADGV